MSGFRREGNRVFHTCPAYARGAGPLIGTCADPGLTRQGRQRYVTGFPHPGTYGTGW
jgi:hypothetical protein